MAFAGLEKAHAEPKNHFQFFLDFRSNVGFKWKEKAQKNSAGTKIASGTVFGDAFLGTGAILVDFLVPAGCRKWAEKRQIQCDGPSFFCFKQVNASICAPKWSRNHFETLLGGCREHSGPFGIVFRPILGRCGVNLGTSSEEPSRTIKLVGGIGRQAFSIL